MGSFGSGRPREQSRLWSLYSVRTKQIRQTCKFRPGLHRQTIFTDGTRITVETLKNRVLINDVNVNLAWTQPHLGGRRAWFCCPNPGCNRRCTVLYGKEQQWACQRCWRANYPSQKEDRYDRLIRKAKDLRRRLGDTSRMAPIDHANMANNPPDKPPRMHWRTYARLACDLRQTETEVANLLIAQSQRLLDRIKGKGAFSP